MDYILCYFMIIQQTFIINIVTPWEFFPSALVDGLSLEWQQVSSSPQDSFQYSGQSQ